MWWSGEAGQVGCLRGAISLAYAARPHLIPSSSSSIPPSLSLFPPPLSLAHCRVGWLLLVSLLCAYFTLIIYFAIDQDPRSPLSFGSVWPAITLLAITFMYAAWWMWKIRATYTAEVNATKKLVILRLGKALVANFFVLPFAYIVGAATPIYERTRVSSGLDIFVILCINAATMWALWPTNAADAFRVYDGSVSAAMLGADIVDGADFTSALDEAYSYTAVGGSDREYSGAV